MDNLDWVVDTYGGLDIIEKRDLDGYHRLVTSVSAAERFNYRGDYWGSADEYQEANVELMEAIEPLLGEKVSFDGGDYVGVVVGIAIDKQYNSIEHTVVVLDGVEEAKGEAHHKKAEAAKMAPSEMARPLQAYLNDFWGGEDYDALDWSVHSLGSDELFVMAGYDSKPAEKGLLRALEDALQSFGWSDGYEVRDKVLAPSGDGHWECVLSFDVDPLGEFLERLKDILRSNGWDKAVTAELHNAGDEDAFIQVRAEGGAAWTVTYHRDFKPYYKVSAWDTSTDSVDKTASDLEDALQILHSAVAEEVG